MEFKTKQLDTEKELHEKEIQLRESEHKQQQQNMQNQIMIQVLQNQNTALQQHADVIKTKNT